MIRNLSTNPAKELDRSAVILIGLHPFDLLAIVDCQYPYFMGASRAKQLLAVAH